MKEKCTGFPYWTCECGNQDVCRPTDERVSVGKAVFRKPGCGYCKRPMQLAFGDAQEAEAVPA